jgi:hypothetical protein
MLGKELKRKSISKKMTKKNKLLFALAAKNAKEAKTVWYMANVLTSITLPHSLPSGHQHKRTNGDTTLLMTAVNEKGELPYGSLPRLVLSYITTQAHKNLRNEKLSPSEKLEIDFGKSFATFLKAVGVSTDGRARKRMREQLLRLLSTAISYQRHDKNNGVAVCQNQFFLSESYQLWWNPKQVSEDGFLANSKIVLSQSFFNEITHKPVPIDIRALQILTKSPLQMDIYIWLTHRFYSLKKETLISWKKLKRQFGTSYADDWQGVAFFRRKFKQAMEKVWAVYPEANVAFEISGVRISPSNPHVEKQEMVKLPVDNSSYPRAIGTGVLANYVC